MSLYTKIIDLQKLNQAWDKVKANKPACGVDEITCEIYDRNRKVELKQLNLELVNHTYKVLPVRLVNLIEENKVRVISLYSMRDKVVQASLSRELMILFDHTFSSCVYSYRDSSSALKAVSAIESAVKSGKYSKIMRTDISNFFDNINQNRLESMLRKTIHEEDVLELIMKLLRTPSVSKNGELQEKIRGIYQGCSISPVLSNLYLADLDKKMETQPVFYARFADDLLIMASDDESLDSARNVLNTTIEDLGLQLNIEKTAYSDLESGFVFLGYQFDQSGKSVPAKALQRLEGSLEDVWLTMTGATLEERLTKGSQILNGWKQYYDEKREIKSIYEYVVLIHMMRDQPELRKIAYERSRFVNSHRDICKYLLEIWTEKGWTDLSLLEYEQYFGISDGLKDSVKETYYHEMMTIYAELFGKETEEKWTSLLQSYADQGYYKESEKVSEKIQSLRDSRSEQPLIEISETESLTEFSFDSETIQLLDDLFTGREDMHTLENLNAENRRSIDFIPEPLSTAVWRKHLEGKETIGTYPIRNNDTVHNVVIDVDVSRKYLIEDWSDAEKRSQHIRSAAEMVQNIISLVKKLGLKVCPEYSGYRGYHIWIFFSEWIPIRYAHSLIDLISSRITETAEDLTIEYFPKKFKRKSGRSGQNIKLPYGIHVLSGERSYLCYEDLSPVKSINEYLSGMSRYSAADIKRVIGAHISSEEKKFENGSKTIVLDEERLDCNSEEVMAALNGCSIMKYLVHKSESTGYLTHFERLSVLHVLGHMGEEGKKLVHTVMSFTLNYKYHVTQGFIERIPDKPVSCIKLRGQYKQVSAEYGCNCVFKRTNNCYPSPVLHGLRMGDDTQDITIPVSRTISEAKKKKVYEEININTKVQALADRFVELRKQKRGVDKSLRKVENDLKEAFDSVSVDCMEINLGLLVRQKLEDGYQWRIEI